MCKYFGRTGAGNTVCQRNTPALPEAGHRWPPAKESEWCGAFESDERVTVLDAEHAARVVRSIPPEAWLELDKSVEALPKFVLLDACNDMAAICGQGDKAASHHIRNEHPEWPTLGDVEYKYLCNLFRLCQRATRNVLNNTVDMSTEKMIQYIEGEGGYFNIERKQRAHSAPNGGQV